MGVFLVLTTFEASAGRWYPLAYVAKLLAVTACLAVLRKPGSWTIPDGKTGAVAVAIGALAFTEWVWVGPALHYPRIALLGTRSAYDPVTSISSPALRVAFCMVRLAGLALIVPLIEELFWRSFLPRFLTVPEDFQSVAHRAVGIVTLFGTALAFGLSHPEWLDGIVCGVAYGALLRWSGSVSACVLAHAVTNALLGAYVLTQHAWNLW